jgi:Ketosteroid isomerase-related protein
MSEKNKEIVNKINAAFSANDVEGFLEHCSGDLSWTMVGDRTVNGKAAVRGFMDEMKSPEPPVFTVDEMIASDDSVACYGSMRMKDGEGESSDWTYCDVYRLKGDKVVELRSFVIKHKDQDDSASQAAG